MRRRGITTEFTTGTAGTAGETAVWTYNTGELWDGTSRLLVALHGHGLVGSDASGALAFNQNTGPGSAIMALARTGRYVICSIQAGGAAPWNKPSVMTTITNAVAAGRTRGCRLGKYGGIGWSMGGLHLAQRIKEDGANIAAAWEWCGAKDMDYVWSTPGHVPISNNATWKTEVNTAFGGSTAAQFAGRNPSADVAAFAAVATKWKICHATDDSVIPYSVSADFVAAANNPNITLRSPAVLGDHTTLFQYVPDDEVVAHFDSASWS